MRRRIALNTGDKKLHDRGAGSIHPAARSFHSDPALEQLSKGYGLELRDFMLIGYLANRGPIMLEQIARTLLIRPDNLLRSVKRLAAAGLVIRDPISSDPQSSSKVRLTMRGQIIARKIHSTELPEEIR